VVAAVGVAGPMTRLTRRSVATIVPHVIAAADQVSARLGYRARAA
jgi:IclR family KDG regulon transcriptional repressor